MTGRATFTAQLTSEELRYLRQLAAQMGYVLTRGRGAGKEGSLLRLLRYLQAGELVIFPAMWEPDELDLAADRLDALAAAEYPGSPEQTLLTATATAIRAAATRQREMDAAEEEDAADYDAALADIAAGAEPIPAEVVYAILDGGNPIRVWRDHRRLSQVELARMAGITVWRLSQLETNKREVTPVELAYLAEALNVSRASLRRGAG